MNKGTNPNFKCNHFGKIGYTIDRCFEIVGFPQGFKRNPNTGKQSFNANSDVKINTNFASSSSYDFTPEQMQKLLNMINDKPSGSIHANMAGWIIDSGANQHLTVSTIGMFNDLKREKILGAGSESSGICLFDMNKYNCIGQSNMIMSFHVSKLLWHDRLGHPADQVLSVLKKDPNITDNTIVPMCEVCQMAKQTREYFPLSDHKSKSLGELVHLDLWGPYSFHSRECYKYFLTIVDDYSRAVWVYLVKSKLPSSVLDGKSPFDLVYKQKPNLSHLKSFGCPCFSTILSNHDEMSFSSNDDGKDPSVEEGSLPHSDGQNFTQVLRSTIAIDVVNNWPLIQLDFNNAFLYNDLFEDVYMTLPDGYNDENKSKVYKLNKSLYGLKQALRQWNAKLTTTLAEQSNLAIPYMLSIMVTGQEEFSKKTGRKITINRSDTDGYDKIKVECFNCYKLGHFAKECRKPRNHDGRNWNQDSSRSPVNIEDTSSKAMVAIDGPSFDWSYMAEEEVPTNMALMAFSDSKIDLSCSGLEEFKQPEFESYGPKSCEIESNNASEDIPNELKESPDAPLVKDRLVLFVEALTMCRLIAITIKGNYTKKAHPSAHRNMAQRAVLMKTSLRLVNIARPINTAHPKTTVHSARPMSRFSKIAPSTVRRPIQKKTTLTNRKFHQKVNPAKRKVNTTRPKAVNTARLKIVDTARPSLAVVNDVRENQGHPQQVQEDQRYIDSGCSRHMTDNMSYLSDFKEFDGGYVTFRGGANGGIITSKGTIQTATKDETLGILKKFIIEIENLVDKKVKVIRCDNGTEFKNSVMNDFCAMKGIKREFSIAKTPQQNGFAERRNRTLIEAAKTRLADSKLPTTFWAEVVNTACYVQNKVLVVKPHNKTPYELFRDNLGKFDGKADEGFFIRYSLNSKAFRVFNTRTKKVEENLHIRFLEDKPSIAGNGPKWLFDINVLTNSMNYVPIIVGERKTRK
nr:putative ribonuclease H-like domain-containing protein [Tanacetum cinerariifolium]